MKVLAVLVVALIGLGGFTAWRVTTLQTQVTTLQAQLDTNAATMQTRAACLDKINTWLATTKPRLTDLDRDNGYIIGSISRCDADAGLVVVPMDSIGQFLERGARGGL